MDDQSRASLHQRLEEILARRAEVEETTLERTGGLFARTTPRSRVPPDNVAAAHAIFHDAIALIREVIGPAVHEAAMPTAYRDPKEQREVLKLWLDQLYLLIQQPIGRMNALAGFRELTFFDVADGLRALDAGEVRPIFAPNVGKNRRANRYSLARRKLDALTWKKRLVAMGHREKDARYEVTVAFGEQWDTIRKWEKQCADILGAEQVKAALATAGGIGDLYMPTAREEPGIHLKHAGERYRNELRRSAELSRSKSAQNSDG